MLFKPACPKRRLICCDLWIAVGVFTVRICSLQCNVLMMSITCYIIAMCSYSDHSQQPCECVFYLKKMLMLSLPQYKQTELDDSYQQKQCRLIIILGLNSNNLSPSCYCLGLREPVNGWIKGCVGV